MILSAALAGSLAGCAGDSGLGRSLVDSGITPTSDVRSANTARPANYIPVGVTPPPPVPDITPAERQNIEKELLEARARVKTLAGAPIDKPLPQNEPPKPAPPARTGPPAPDLSRGVY